MNQAGRDALRAAGLAGVPQIKFAIADANGGYCAGGVLSLLNHLDVAGWSENPVSGCHLCGATHDGGAQPIGCEWMVLVHLNNDHGLDFLGIAEKMPVSPEP